MRTGPYTSPLSFPCVPVSSSIILVGSKSPNLSFHAKGKTINAAFVSTSPSQVRLFEVSRTFSIFTETIIRFKYGFCTAFEKSWLLFITHPSSAASLSAEGAQCNSLGQRPRVTDVKRYPSAEGAE